VPLADGGRIRKSSEVQMAKSFFWVGIDPGISGGAARMCGETGEITSTIKFSESERDIHEWFLQIESAQAVIEKVHSMPKQGVRSTFTFGCQYGFCRAMLVAHLIPFQAVAPNVWMKFMGLKTRGDKKVNYAMAQERFPNVKITHAIADACLLAEYARRIS
jgi:crossover junction endodeoxyribonuclease RuvC